MLFIKFFRMAPDLVLEEYPVDIEPTPVPTKKRVSIIRKKPKVAIVPRRKRNAPTDDELSPSQPSPKKQPTSSSTSRSSIPSTPAKIEPTSAMSQERVRRSVRVSQGRPPTRFE